MEHVKRGAKGSQSTAALASAVLRRACICTCLQRHTNLWLNTRARLDVAPQGKAPAAAGTRTARPPSHTPALPRLSPS